MRVWLLTVGEPLRTDSSFERAWRTELLAQQLIGRNHNVVWWSSAFDHFTRHLRSPVDVPIAVSPEMTVWHLSGRAYRRNISVDRLRNHREVAASFRRLAPREPRPDVIISSLPILELCAAAVDYGAAHHVPVALDIRDLWPDVLFDLVPRPLRAVAPYAGRWMTRELQHAARGATAILGLTDEFVQWGLDAAGRVANTLDRPFPMAYPRPVPNARAQETARVFWRLRGIPENPAQKIVCFFGTLGWMFDFDTLLAAADRLQTTAPEILFVICGDGNNREAIASRAKSLSNVLLPGRVGAAEIAYLMRRSIAGLAPYRSLRNFEDNLPNKPIEYMAGGLPTVSCRLRVLGRVLDRYQCGLTYAHGDAEGLAGAVSTLAKNPALQAAMSARAKNLYEEQYVADRVYGAMARHIEAIAAAAAVPA